MRIAFFGGSFDPPHFGHLAIARAALQALSLDRVLFAPVGFQPLKPLGSAASFADRVAMTRLAIDDDPAFELSFADAPQEPANPAPNYTIDTLTALRQNYPQSTEWFLLLGADAFRLFPRWRSAQKIPFLADLIVASRPNSDSDAAELANLPADLIPGITISPLPEETGQPRRFQLTNHAGDHAELTLLTSLDIDISATQLRSQIHGASGLPDQIPPKVLQYIRTNRLYLD